MKPNEKTPLVDCLLGGRKPHYSQFPDNAATQPAEVEDQVKQKEALIGQRDRLINKKRLKGFNPLLSFVAGLKKEQDQLTKQIAALTATIAALNPVNPETNRMK